MKLLAAIVPRVDRGAIARFSRMRWASLAVTDRRWTVPLSAAAVGIGLFVGVAIGPRTDISLGTSAQVVDATPPIEAPAGERRAAQGSAGGSPDPVPPLSTGSGSTPGLPDSAPSFTPDPYPSVPAPSFTSPGYTPPATAAEPAASPAETVSEPAITELAGTVVAVNPAAQSYTLAGAGGELQAIHTRDLPHPGSRIEVKARELANGTLAETSARKRTGERGRVVFEGTVTFADRDLGAYTVSAPGVSALVHLPSSAGPGSLPRMGSEISVDASLRPAGETDAPADEAEAGGGDGCGQPPRPLRAPETTLVEVDHTVETDSVETASAAAIVQGVCRSERELLLSADDVRASGVDLRVELEEGIQLRSIEAGDAVVAEVEIDRARERMTATEIAANERIREADDPELIQPAGTVAP